jgi:hypothetical protein
VTAQEKLIKIAEGVVSDIEGDHPGLDTGYDLWVEELRDAKGTRHHVGVIDMGDSYQGVYTWDGKDWHDDASWGDPHIIIDRIIAKRAFDSSWENR